MRTPTPQAVKAAKLAFEYFREFYPDPEDLEALASIIDRETKSPTALKWLAMTNDELRLSCGEITAGEIRAVRAVVGNIARAEYSGWLPIDDAPNDDTILDLWSKSEGRLCNYYRVQRNPDNVFYDPEHSGVMTIRDATHFRPIPLPPP